MTRAVPDPRRTYDHRIRNQIVATGNPDLFPELEIPRRTALTWIRRGASPVVQVEQDAVGVALLRARLVRLERRVAVLTALLRLALTMLRISGSRLELERLPDGRHKRAVLDAVVHARSALPLASALRVLRLSSSRYHARVNAQTECELDDRVSCARTRVSRLTARELMRIKDLVLSPAYRHMSIRALALHAQRVGSVFAHPCTWASSIRARGWRRPRQRVYPRKQRVGVRGTRPNEKWHIDVTIIRLLDGTKVYVHAVIDNFSRKILAWKASERLEPMGTCDVLIAAAKHLHRDEAPDLISDSGTENVNSVVDDVLEAHSLRRVLAQVDVSYSNSIIEAWWRSLRHQWLYLNQLDSIASVRRLVTFYVHEHNSVMPHAAFKGETPDELYYGTRDGIVDELVRLREQARARRIAENRAAACGICPRATAEREEVAAA